MISHSELFVIMSEPGFHIVLLQNVQPVFSVTPVIIALVFIAVALIGSALVSASEVSFFSINPDLKDELEKNNSRSARLAIALAEKPKELLATIVIANNFFNVTFILLAAYLSAILFPADLYSCRGYGHSITRKSVSMRATTYWKNRELMYKAQRVWWS